MAKPIKNIGLGRGLNAIFETEAADFDETADQSQDGGGKVSFIEEIRIEHIIPNPKQPRSVFDAEALEELAESIRTLGVIQPVTVKKEGDRYIIISGERRWRASQMAGLESIPTYIREADDQALHEMALVENIQRQDLNAMEIAIGLQRLIDECGITQDTVASRVGKKRSTVANYLRLLALPIEVQSAVKQDLISMGHAKAIASAPEEQRVAVLKKTLKKNLSVRQLEDAVKKLNEGKSAAEPAGDDELPDSYTQVAEQIARLFTEDVKVKKGRNGGGMITMGFGSDNDINNFLNKLEKLQ